MGQQGKSQDAKPSDAGGRTEDGHVRPITVSETIEKGEQLAKTRDETATAITANRDLCRLLVANGYANDDEKARISQLYPAPARKKPAGDASS